MNPNRSGGYVSKIDRLIDEHERALEALKLTRDMLNGEAREKKQTRSNGALTAALAHEAVRKPSRRTPAVRTKVPGYGRKIREQRERSKAFLDQFDPTEPRSITTTGMGSLVRRGYLKRKGDGYVRTTKEYLVRR